ncbi:MULTISPECIES: FecR family protein [Alphaproteobacteria]|uniref:FecR family protein n=1 Tax=Alphaproteobacteria TaxID=28211 RepID=UPI000DB71FAB|nr:MULTISPECIES: FecR domain-containing protein [Alphaproteobacteria]MBY0302713.1 FecR domain-containing protein [Sphingomonas ginsenosidimutans]PZP65975.1 MAG: iron dicitrate transport regulator FecR [Methylorubrum populi]
MADNGLNDASAARWAIRLDEGAFDAHDQAALDAWLGGDERRHGALLRAQATLAYLDRGRALGEAASAAPADDRPGEGSSRRGFLVGGGALAGLAAAGVAGFALVRLGDTQLRTTRGEIRRVPLADGSVASINTSSAIRVRMAEKRRDVTLEAGEVFFEVARDRRRPFVVSAGQVHVEAVGTAFSVRRRAAGTEVLVTEGVVKVWVDGHEDLAARIAAGSRSFVVEAAPAVASEPVSGSDERTLAWRSGDIALDGEPLAYAVAELNRYNAQQLVIDSPELGQEPLVGYFRIDQPEAFGRAIGATLGAKVVTDGDTIHLSR